MSFQIHLVDIDKTQQYIDFFQPQNQIKPKIFYAVYMFTDISYV
jgi:hypothetical protein